MATTATIVPVEVYLHTSYSPDCDYIDGEVRERNLGEQPHASVQKFFIKFLAIREEQWSIRVFPEQRVQISARRYRIADVAVARRETKLEPVIYTPPLLCVEVVSKDDSLSDYHERVEDYFNMGVTAVWVVDPRRRRAYFADSKGSLVAEPVALVVSGTEIRVLVPEIFRELEEMEAMSAE